MNGIVTHICHFGPDKAKNTDLFTAETSRDFICGFGMGGKEIFGVQADYLYNFNVARQAGLCLTTYAGEWGGAENVRQEIFDLKVETLGHGAQIIKDSHFLDEFNACNISLEVCPGSNVAIGIYRMTHSHPTEKLWTLGVNVTVSTDDPPFFYTDMTEEYAALSRAHRWVKEDFKALNETALNAAFCDNKTKDTLIKRLDTE